MCQAKSESSSATRASLSEAAQTLVPTHPAAKAALELAVSSLPASILYHSLRVFIYAQALTRKVSQNGSKSLYPGGSLHTVSVEPHVLFVACILHDLGTVNEYDVNPERFEVCGAEEAVRILRAHEGKENEAAIREAWLAISLHTSPGIAECISGTVQIVRFAVKTDFGRYDTSNIPLLDHEKAVIEKDLPRLDIEKELGDAVVRQGLATRNKAPTTSWPGALLKSKEDNPDWVGVNKAF
ncbi:hypothetical protein PT974_05274 [Cladobotryum mycophilum]|uniref:HD domain-containing protein n=1 Tax=Cladobotryum mycophilum TaxID=491253 RepID=A0ABR0SI95_9HYPO